jgi:peptidoglycan/xylan/chitin deacetylase (PgdA/CDA1 family)
MERKNPMVKKIGVGLFIFSFVVISACSSQLLTSSPSDPAVKTEDISQQMIRKYGHEQPEQWGEHITGVIDRFPTEEKEIALTFDACGGQTGKGYDEELIQYLIAQHVPATLFINSRWIDANRETFSILAHEPLFEIENHGTEHRPLSVNGKSVYGIAGTKNIAEVVNEVLSNEQTITQLTGRKPKFFRSGTAYYDEIAVRIVHDLGEKVSGFAVLGDAGATLPAAQVKQALLSAKPGSIVICHFNHPEKETFAGVKQAIPILKEKGFRFVKLEDVVEK